MFRSLSSTKSAVRALLGASIVLAAATFVRAPADAHFILQTPAASITQDGLGNPQKLGPCGNESGGSATGEVTVVWAREAEAANPLSGGSGIIQARVQQAEASYRRLQSAAREVLSAEQFARFDARQRQRLEALSAAGAGGSASP